jgi:hypothetical protein
MSNDSLNFVAGSVFGNLIDAQLKQERDRKTSLEQRGMALVTAAGTLVALAFAFATFAKGGSGVSLSALAKGFFIAALVAFIVSGIFGVLTNKPALYGEADVRQLKRLTKEDHWIWNDVPGAARRVAELEVSMIASGRTANAAKARHLRNSILLLFAALCLLSAAIITVLVSA